MSALLLDDIGLGLLRQLDEAWEAMHATRDDIGDVTYGGHRRESELVDRDIAIDDLTVQFADHVSFLYDNRLYEHRTLTRYRISDQFLDWIANMEFERKFQGWIDEDTLTELAIEALKIYRR